jgi:hypothetical protein
MTFWYRSPQTQRGDLCPDSTVARAGASGSVHSLSVRSARTEDLRAELNCRRVGEDARISIERARNR